MPVLDLTFMGDPVLLASALPVGDPTLPELRLLAAGMVATMRAATGIGIAAPQVGTSLRLIVAMPIADRADDREIEPLIIADPVLEPLDGATEEGIEGCLSIPGIRGLVPRYQRVGWRGLDLDGRSIGGTAEGLFARILQHEVDHLDGVLFLMRMTDLRKLAMNREVHHLTGTPPADDPAAPADLEESDR